MKGKTPARFEEPTARQVEILEAVLNLPLQGEQASIDAIARRFGINRNAARNHLLALEKKGYLEDQIETVQVRSGNWRLTKRARALVER